MTEKLSPDAPPFGAGVPKVYIRERSFDFHRVHEAVYYFCLNHGLSFADA